ERDRLGVEADLVVARLILERAAHNQRVLALQRCLRLRCPLELDILEQRKWLRVDRYALVQRSEEIDSRRGIFDWQRGDERLRFELHRDRAVRRRSWRVDVNAATGRHL